MIGFVIIHTNISPSLSNGLWYFFKIIKIISLKKKKNRLKSTAEWSLRLRKQNEWTHKPQRYPPSYLKPITNFFSSAVNHEPSAFPHHERPFTFTFTFNQILFIQNPFSPSPSAPLHASIHFSLWETKAEDKLFCVRTPRTCSTKKAPAV